MVIILLKLRKVKTTKKKRRKRKKIVTWRHLIDIYLMFIKLNIKLKTYIKIYEYMACDRILLYLMATSDVIRL